jgi:hypothetical protein
MLSGRCKQARTRILLLMALVPIVVYCRGAVAEMEIRHDIRYLAAFSSASLVNPEDEKQFQENFQSRYRSRVVLLRPVTGQAYLPHLNARISLFAVIKISAQREARVVAHELERALRGQLISLFPLSESVGSQDSFSGQTFYLALEKRTNAFSRLNGSARIENLKLEADDIARDRNLLSYFAALMLADTPYHSVHILGFSGLAESEYETFDGLYHRSIRKLEAADTTLVEKIR